MGSAVGGVRIFRDIFLRYNKPGSTGHMQQTRLVFQAVDDPLGVEEGGHDQIADVTSTPASSTVIRYFVPFGDVKTTPFVVA